MFSIRDKNGLNSVQHCSRTGEKWTLPNNILRRKANLLGHILRRNCLLPDTAEERVTEVKGVGRITQLLDDLRNVRYWELNEEAQDRKSSEKR